MNINTTPGMPLPSNVPGPNAGPIPDTNDALLKIAADNHIIGTENIPFEYIMGSIPTYFPITSSSKKVTYFTTEEFIKINELFQKSIEGKNPATATTTTPAAAATTTPAAAAVSNPKTDEPLQKTSSEGTVSEKDQKTAYRDPSALFVAQKLSDDEIVTAIAKSMSKENNTHDIDYPTVIEHGGKAINISPQKKIVFTAKEFAKIQILQKMFQREEKLYKNSVKELIDLYVATMNNPAKTSDDILYFEVFLDSLKSKLKHESKVLLSLLKINEVIPQFENAVLRLRNALSKPHIDDLLSNLHSTPQEKKTDTIAATQSSITVSQPIATNAEIDEEIMVVAEGMGVEWTLSTDPTLLDVEHGGKKIERADGIYVVFSKAQLEQISPMQKAYHNFENSHVENTKKLLELYDSLKLHPFITTKEIDEIAERLTIYDKALKAQPEAIRPLFSLYQALAKIKSYLAESRAALLPPLRMDLDHLPEYSREHIIKFYGPLSSNDSDTSIPTTEAKDTPSAGKRAINPYEIDGTITISP